MLSKESFCKIMNIIVKTMKNDKRDIDAINEILHRRDPDCFGDAFGLFGYEMCNDVIEWLEYEMGVSTQGGDYSDITYFIYELDCGEGYDEKYRNRGKYPITFSDGKGIHCGTVEELYDLIMYDKEMENE